MDSWVGSVLAVAALATGGAVYWALRLRSHNSRLVTALGCTLRELLQLRMAAGNFSGDPDRYISETLAEIAVGKPFNRIRNMPNGRVMALATRPMPNGGWVVTHDDITDQRAAEEKHASLAGQEQRRLRVEAAIRTFRERVEAVLATVAASAGTMRTTATSLSGASDQASQRAEGAVRTSNEASDNVDAAATAAEELLRPISVIDRSSSIRPPSWCAWR